MSATIEISLPDPLLKALGGEAAELPRRTLEALVERAYCAGQITHAQAGEIPTLDRWQTDAFLKQAQAFRPTVAEEFAADLAALRRIEK
jgi:hypothetical protein